MRKSLFARWRSSFLTGLAVALPGLITLAVVKWLFGTVSSFTDALLFFLPYCGVDPKFIYKNGVDGAMFWYWSLLALAVAVALISTVGVLTRYYIGKKVIDWTDRLLLSVPLLNKFYSAIKQVNEAFSGNKNSFKTVVLVEFPSAGMYSVGFLTGEQNGEVKARTQQSLVSIFVPTTPNPTSGFLILVPKEKVIELEMSVADGVKYIVSLGSIAPEHLPRKIK